jgi:hypothetical protein
MRENVRMKASLGKEDSPTIFTVGRPDLDLKYPPAREPLFARRDWPHFGSPHPTRARRQTGGAKTKFASPRVRPDMIDRERITQIRNLTEQWQPHRSNR